MAPPENRLPHRSIVELVVLLLIGLAKLVATASYFDFVMQFEIGSATIFLFRDFVFIAMITSPKVPKNYLRIPSKIQDLPDIEILLKTS